MSRRSWPPRLRLAVWVLTTALLPAWSAWPAAAQSQTAGPAPQLQAEAIRQIQALVAEKRGRTAAQRKLESHLLHTLLHARGDARLEAVPHLRLLAPDADGTTLVDVRVRTAADVKPTLLALRADKALPVAVHFKTATIRARVPVIALETIAALETVRFVAPARAPFFAHVDSEGDTTHQAIAARATFGTSGAGVKICAISDGVDSLALLQTEGDLPAVDVLAGQAGSGDEGTAMLEILHDLAPDATLGFASGNPDEATFANNIEALRTTSRCDILVDDVEYLSETPFQDTLLADAVNQVTAGGALYFSAAGNEGALDAGTSGTWEGDFHPNGSGSGVLAGVGPLHDFGDGGQSDPVTASAQAVELHWAEPAGAACTDYDLYAVDAAMTTIVDASTSVQDCSQDPVEIMGALSPGERIVVSLFNGSALPMINVRAFRGTLQLATAGSTRGHSAAAAAFSLAAAPAAAGIAAPGYPSGPYPGPFTAAQLPEPFSSDGPRRIFFDVDGNLLPGAPAGVFTSTGGVVRQKPDLTAADGVSTDVTVLARFFGTSAAAPHAAALAALLKSAQATITPTQVRSALTGSAIDLLAPAQIGWDRDTGFGIVMADRALAAIGAPLRFGFALGAITPHGLTGNGDSSIDPGEDWALSIVLKNIGGAGASGIHAMLSSSMPGVAFTTSTAAYPDLAPGAMSAASVPFTFSPYGVSCGAVIPFTLAVTAIGNASPTLLTFALVTGQPGSHVTVHYTGPLVAIPDGGSPPGAGNESPGLPAIASLTASTLGRLAGVAFRFDGATCTTAAGSSTVGVDHTFINDLTFDLQSPAGTSVRILSRIDSDGHNLCQITLSDGASPSIESASSAQAPFTGAWAPNLPFGKFQGEDPTGAWQLTAIDHFGGNTGNLRAFSLLLTPAVCATVTPASARIVATKAVTGGTLTPGGTVVYAVTLSNQGDGASFDNPGDELTDVLPSELVLTAATATAGSITTSGNTVSWNGGIPAGASVVITISARIQDSVAPTSLISNQGTVHYDALRNGTNQTTLATAGPGGGATTFAVNGAEVPALSPVGEGVLALLTAACAVRFLRRNEDSRPA
jgi:uncharacterized repeat protein (TIGR01451 family)